MKTREFRQANPNGLGNNRVMDNKKPGVDENGLHKNAKWLGFLLSNNLAGSKCRGKKRKEKKKNINKMTNIAPRACVTMLTRKS